MEVVIAIGVTSFMLISILGMMAYATHVVQQSDKNARLSTVLGQVLSTVNTQPFNQVLLDYPSGATYYFSSEGLPLTSSSGAYYQCNVVNATPSGAQLQDAFGYQLLEPLQITIRWPKNGNAPFANTNIIVTSILNYE